MHNCVPYISAITPYSVSSGEVQAMKTGVGIMNAICDVMFHDHLVAVLTSRNASSRALCTVSVPVSEQ